MIKSNQAVTQELIKEFIITVDYEELSSGEFLKEDFSNAAYLIAPNTDLYLLQFVILAQRSGLHLAFIDPIKMQSVNLEEFISIYDCNVSNLMYPGYAEIYKSDFDGKDYGLYEIQMFSYLIEDIMIYFGRSNEYNLRAVELHTITEITDFINHPVVKSENDIFDQNINLSKYKPYIILISIFLLYWIASDLKTAMISTVLASVVYFGYKSFKQFKKDITG